MINPDNAGKSSPGEPAGDPDPAALAARFGVEYLGEVADDMLDPALVSNLHVDWARSHCLIPVRVGGEPCALTCDPSAMGDIRSLELLLGLELRPLAASRETILGAIERCYYRKNDSAKDFMRGIGDPAAGAAAGVAAAGEDLLQMSGDAPVTRLINLILLEAVKARASDIHFEPEEDAVRIRYRIDGTLYIQTTAPKHMELALVSRLKVMAHMDIAEKRLPQDGMARVRVGEREIDVRVSTIPIADGERVVLRLLDRDASLIPLTDLGMSPENLAVFQDILRQTYGLILVTGPTGSGKTTTLYAAISRLDREGMNIMTIEDPVEYRLPGVAQMQVKPKIGLTFGDGLKHILRQDPDVILVGETRDLETAETAARSSLTGHLVLTTVHTNDAAGAVVRMTDMGIEPYLLAASLRAVLAQRLVRKLCPKCRFQAAVTAADARMLGSAGGSSLEGRKAWTAKGCPECLGGYKGRLGIFELMVIDQGSRELIRMGRHSITELRQAALKNGMTDLASDAVSKILSGSTSVAEVVRVLGHTGVTAGS